jgi:hypothetical protein
MTVPHVEFDATVDDIVDAQLRMTTRTTAYRRNRLWSQVAVAASGAVAVTIPFVLNVRELSPAVVGIATGVALGFGAVLFYLYGLFHNQYVKRNAARLVRELYGGKGFHCVFEIREHGLWCTARDTEVTLAWSRFVRIVEAGDLELWFDPGLAVIRARAFSTLDEKRRFVEAVGRAAGEGIAP